MSNTENLIQILTIVAACLVTTIVVLIAVYFYIQFKNKKKDKNVEETLQEEKKTQTGYTPKSIFDFMDFEKIEDNMIIQKKGKYLMVLECQGVNYDLMSEMERTSVEQGFIEFLNTLRTEIQIYVQTRTVNLEESIAAYKLKYKDIEDRYVVMEEQYEQMQKSGKYSDQQLKKAYMELVKQRNKYEYTKDIIANTERNSLNSSVLHKKYYIIVPYYEDEMSTADYSKEEIQSMVFSELYTKAKSIIMTLSRCEVTAKILDSDALVDLLYVAYNRDDSDLFSAKKALRAGFEDIYSTAPDVLDKKMKLLDQEIEEQGKTVANQAISEARSDKELMLKLREENIQQFVYDFAENLIDENQEFIGNDIAETAKAKIKRKKKEAKEGGKSDDVQQKKTRGRKAVAK